ncbi:DUF3850 domain-containing protein [Spirosoma sp. HMF4905]|uniref:DUF3850 domain-containing protein n=1 Tax=Spirosoma arboris TaxID=2682092 RepID=A0A7K1SKB2_9BACT|nr:DUF3850 domain-containing protein [Spirosoma arboris]
MRHELKCLPEFFQDLKAGHKCFEVRRNDRNFQAGEELYLREWSPEGGYTEDTLLLDITYVLPGGQNGIDPEYCVMSLAWSMDMDFSDFLEEGPEHEDGFPITTFCG